MKKQTILALALGSALLAPAIHANTVTRVATSAQSAEINKPFSLTFSFAENQGPVGCGLVIDWGDGKTDKLRVGEGQQLQPPYTVEHVYAAPGEYKIRIGGEAIARGLRSVLACDVRREGTVAVIDPVEAARQAEARAVAERERRERQEAAERERRERQEADARQRAAERAEAEAARQRQREQMAALVNNRRAPLGDRLAGSCYMMFPDADEFAKMTNNAPFDSCEPLIIQSRIRSEYAMVMIRKFTSNDQISDITIPSRGMRDGVRTKTISYTTRGDTIITDPAQDGCVITDRLEVGMDTLKINAVSMTGTCNPTRLRAHAENKEAQKRDTKPYKLLRP